MRKKFLVTSVSQSVGYNKPHPLLYILYWGPQIAIKVSNINTKERADYIFKIASNALTFKQRLHHQRNMDFK